MAYIARYNGYDLKDAEARDSIGNIALLATENKSSVVDSINDLVEITNTITTTANTFMSISNELASKINVLTSRVVALEDGNNVPSQTVLTGILATYTGGDVLVGTSLTELIGLTVVATYSDGSTTNVTDYTLSGVIAEGNNTIIVAYEGFAAMFTVTGVAELKPASLLILNNRTLATNYSNDWFYETKYFNPSDYGSGAQPSVATPCGIADLTENSITVTEPGGAGGKGVSFTWSINNFADNIDRRGKTFIMTWDKIAGNTARFRARVGGVSSPSYIDLAKGNDGKTSATIVVSEDGHTVTINGTDFVRTSDVISYIVFFFGSATGTTTSYTGISLVEATE